MIRSGFLPARGEQEDGDVLAGFVGAELVEHFEARHARQHEVEDDQRRSVLLREAECVGTVAGRRNPEAGLGEVIDDECDDIRLVVDDEDAFSAGARAVLRHARRASSRRWIVVRIISMATAFWPPLGRMMSAYRFPGSTNC